jgi:hypothetical protein
MAVEKVGGGRTHWPTGPVELSHGPINIPLPVKVDTHTTFWRFHLQSSLS